MSLDLKLMRQVIALAKHGNFARAAEALHLSSPALSRSIAGLEEELGARLFDRTRNGVLPTEYGQTLVERGRDILRREQELRRELQLMRGLEIGELAVAAGPFPHALSCGPALAELLAGYPQVHVRLEQTSPHGTIARVLDGSVDLGIADLRDWQDDLRLQIEPLPRHTGVWACRPGHPLAGRKGLVQAEVLAYPLICAALPHPIATLFGENHAAGRTDAETGRFLPAVTLDSLQLGPHIAAATDTVFLTVPGIIAADLERGELVILDLHQPWQRTEDGFISKRGRSLSEVARRFMDCVRRVEARLIDEEANLLAIYGTPVRTERPK